MAEKEKVLIVHPNGGALETLRWSLEEIVEVHSATTASTAIAKLEDKTIAVIISEIAPTFIEGEEFHLLLKRRYPSVVRMVVSSAGDLPRNIETFNESEVFRYVLKPCSSESFSKSVQAAIGQHHLVVSEKELLQSTLFGTVKTLTAILEIVDSNAFDFGKSLRFLIAGFIRVTDCKNEWEVEIAALLADLGSIIVPTPLLIKIRTNQELNIPEKALKQQIFEHSSRLLRNIPRLDGVSAIIRLLNSSPEERNKNTGAAVLFLCRKYLKLRQFQDQASALEEMARTPEISNTFLFPSFREHVLSIAEPKREKSAVQIEPGLLKKGMVLMVSLNAPDGSQIASKGQVLTEFSIARIRSFCLFYGMTTKIMVQE